MKTVERRQVEMENRQGIVEKSIVVKRIRSRKLVPIQKFPPIPMRGLCEKATQEERERAQQTAQVIMDYWMAPLTKAEAAAKLNLKPIRFWQMTNQAVVGMTAGLLTQPRLR